MPSKWKFATSITHHFSLFGLWQPPPSSTRRDLAASPLRTLDFNGAQNELFLIPGKLPATHTNSFCNTFCHSTLHQRYAATQRSGHFSLSEAHLSITASRTDDHENINNYKHTQPIQVRQFIIRAHSRASGFQIYSTLVKW